KYTGLKVDFDSSFGAQCMDLVRQYCYEVLGVSLAPPIGNNTAEVVWDVYNKEAFTRVPNTPEAVVKPGVIVIWKTGHISIGVSGNVTKFISFDQNYPTGSAPKLVEHTYKD